MVPEREQTKAFGSAVRRGTQERTGEVKLVEKEVEYPVGVTCSGRVRKSCGLSEPEGPTLVTWAERAIESFE